MKSVGEIITETLIPQWKQERKRHPVNNHEERLPIESVKRAIIHERDGNRCKYCGIHSKEMVLDHIIPRSSYFADQLTVADRSDNLQSACWTCNENRSNYETSQRQRPGVTYACWECRNPDPYPDDYPGGPIPAYCGRHGGITGVPDEGWLL